MSQPFQASSIHEMLDIPRFTQRRPSKPAHLIRSTTNLKATKTLSLPTDALILPIYRSIPSLLLLLPAILHRPKQSNIHEQIAQKVLPELIYCPSQNRTSEIA